jgi:hypothetical protein
MSDNRLTILAPLMQYGFAGMTAVLLAIVVWMVDCAEGKFEEVLKMQKETNQVIERNTAAITALARSVAHIPHE